MNRSVKSKTIRHDCHLLVRAEENHLKTLVFLLQLFKSNRHKLDSIKGDELCFLFGFTKIVAQNRLLFSIKPKNSQYLLTAESSTSQVPAVFGLSYVQCLGFYLLQNNQHCNRRAADPWLISLVHTRSHSVSNSQQHHLGTLSAILLILYI